MNLNSFYLFLKNNNISDDIIDIIKTEEIDGESFLSLNDNDLKEMNIKIGPKKKLLNLIQKFNN